MLDVCGAHLVVCDKQNVQITVKKTLDLCKEKGFTPYYIYGNEFGTGNREVPVRAYVECYKELKMQENEMGIQFDYVFLANGTGMTRSGLIAGKLLFNGDEEIIGISIARDSSIEKEIVKNYIEAYMKSISGNDKISNNIEKIYL